MQRSVCTATVATSSTCSPSAVRYCPISAACGANELIDTARLQEEAQDEAQVEVQRYVDDPAVTAPSVITLNALATAHAANDYLFTTTGPLRPDAVAD